MTSSVRSPFGAGVRDTRIVSPMPSCSRTDSPAVDATIPFRAHAGFGQAEVQRVIAPSRQVTIDSDQILHAADLRAENDLVAGKPVAFRGGGRLERTDDDRVQRNRASIQRLRQKVVLVHHPRQQSAVERSPVHTDAHGPVVLDRPPRSSCGSCRRASCRC